MPKNALSGIIDEISLQILKTMPVPIVITDSELNILFRNDKYTQVFKTTKVVLPISNIETSPELFESEIREFLFTDDEVLCFEFIEIEYDIKVTKVKISEDKTLLQFTFLKNGIILDDEKYDKKRKIREKLDQSKKDYKSLFESIPVGIYRSSLDGKLLLANQAFKNIVGFEGDLSELDLNWHTKNINYSRENFLAQIIEFGSVTGFESTYIKPDGSELRFKENAKLVRDSQGKILYIEGIIADNTESYNIRKTLKESEEKYRLLFEKSKDAILLLSRDKWLDCNESALNLFGYENKEQIIGKHPHEVSPIFQISGALSSIHAQEMIEQAFENGYNHFEWTHTKADGSIFYTDVMLTVIPINGEFVLYSVLRDITEQRNFRETIKMSEEKHRSFFEQSNEGLLVFDKKGKILEFNRALEEIAGFSREFVIGKNISIFSKSIESKYSSFIQDEKTIFKNVEHFIPHFKEGESILFETEYLDLDENISYLQINVFPILSAFGLTIGGLVRNVTEQKIKNEEIKKAKDSYELMLKTSPIPIAVINLNSDILYLSPKCKALLELDEDFDYSNITGLNFYNGLRKNFGIIELTLERELVYNYEVELKSSKGKIIYAELNASLIKTPKGEPEAILINIIDITPRKEIEIAKDAATKAIVEAKEKRHEALSLLEDTSKLASLGVVAGGITHEITQPLNAIKIGAEGILSWNKMGSGVLPEVIVKMLEGIGGATDRIDEIVKHMRSFWVEENDQVTKIDLNDTVIAALNLAKLRIQSHEITFDLQLNPEPIFIKANNRQMELVINNLISNAVNSLDKIDIKNKTIRLTTLINGNSANLLVEDNGAGLPPVPEDKLFDPFFSTGKESGGTGLGLAIVRMFVEKFNAKIKCFNNDSGGATFFICFDLYDC